MEISSSNSSRRKSTSRSSVAAGSVLESRMKMEEVKEGIKGFNGEQINTTIGPPPPSPQASPRVKRVNTTQSLAIAGKRKMWRSENSEKNPIQTVAERSELRKNSDDNGGEVSGLTVEGIKKSPVQSRKMRSDLGGGERSPIQVKKTRSEFQKALGFSESVDGGERNSVRLRKSKSVGNKASDELGKDSDGCSESDSLELRKVKSDPNTVNNESGKNVDGSAERNLVQLRKVKTEIHASTDGAEGNSAQSSKLKVEFNQIIGNSGHEHDGAGDETQVDLIELERNSLVFGRVTQINSGGSTENPVDRTEEFDECEEKVITSSFGNAGQMNSAAKMDVDDDDDGVDVDEDDDELVDEEEEEEEEIDEEIEVEENVFDVKEMNVAEEKCNKVANDVNKFNQIYVDSNPISSIPGKHLPALKNQTLNIQKNFSRPSTDPIRVSEGCQRIPETQSKLQNLVDLFMWRDVSKSAFVFGIGAFMIISSSYTKDLNISLISVIGYLGLVYLAIIFLYRSILCRGHTDVEDSRQNYVVGEGEAIWLVRLVLPHLNEFLLKIKDLFSGDPAVTMKLAVVLFVLARCGSSITLWKMVKLCFFGAFTVPKICSSYSSHITAYGKFWINRFRDAWESCSHKKAVAFAIFTLFWNLSSVVARIWAAFMLFAAFRYYHHSIVKDETAAVDDSRQTQEVERRRSQILQARRRSTLVHTQKQKKGS